MNQQILDAPFEDEFNFLETGETILWKSGTRNKKEKKLTSKKSYNPSNKLTSNHFAFAILIFIFSIYLISYHWLLFVFFSLTIFAFLLFIQRTEKLNLKKKETTEYYITPKRIIFLNPSDKNPEVFSIDRKDLINIKLQKTATFDTIKFEVVNHPTSDILTRQFFDGKSRIVGKMENIENAEEAIRLLYLPK